MKRHTFYMLMASCCLSLSITKTQAQVDLVDSVPRKGISLELQGGYISSKAVPFWMRSNQYGSIPLEGASGSMIARAFQNYKLQGEWQGKTANGGTNWDWGYGIEGRANIGKSFQGQLIDAHVKVRFAMFEARLGRSKDVMGLNGDTLLTSGNFAVSGNALGVPKFEISIPEYYRLPWFDGLLSFKGNFANGYMGRVPVSSSRVGGNGLTTYLHQKSLYGRIAKANWKLELFGGFNHQAQWGGEKKVYGDAYELNFIESLFHVATGKAYGGGGSGVPRSKVGNHQGSIDVGASYNFGDVSVMAYRQTFYDVGALSKLANVKDGLNGIVFTNNNYKNTSESWGWSKLLLEFFYSKDQAGYPWSKRTKSGDENYYNNFFYEEGWSYNGLGMGTPLIVPENTVREGQISDPQRYFISNRVSAGHIGLQGNIQKWLFFTKLTYARHYGTFATSEYGSSLGLSRREPIYGIFEPVNQFSAFVQGERNLNNGMTIGGKFAVDQGKLFNNTTGLLIFVRKNFGM